MMYTWSSLTANWMLIKPTVSKASAMRLVYSSIWLMIKSPKL